MAYLTVSPQWSPFGFSWKRPNFYDNGPADTGGPSVAGFERFSLYPSQFAVRYARDQERVETINFTLNADVQPLVSARADSFLTVELTSAEIDQPIDAGGALPIGDVRRNSYLITNRGQQSLQYLYLLCRAKLIARARAVALSFSVSLDVGMNLTLRHSVTITDPRLPGGTATGKITALTFSLDGDSGESKADVTIACCIGRGNALGEPEVGTPEYVDPSYISEGYQIYAGQQIAVSPDVYALTVMPTPITGGDLNLFNPKISDLVTRLEVFNGSLMQEAILLLGMDWPDTNAAIAAVNEIPTRVELQMVPVNDATQATPFTPELTALMIPKHIDLEAAGV